MRTNKEALLTIVEVLLFPLRKKIYITLLSSYFLIGKMNSVQVFIHDPLYKWALSPLKALQRQKVVHELLDLRILCRV